MTETTQAIDAAIAEARATLEKGDVLPPALTRVAMVTMEIGDDEEAHAIAREVLALPSRQVMRRESQHVYWPDPDEPGLRCACLIGADHSVEPPLT